MPTYGNINGAQKEIKPWYTNINGAQTLLKNLHGNIGGVQKTIYSGDHCWAKYTSYQTGSYRYGNYTTNYGASALYLQNIEHDEYIPKPGEYITDCMVTYGTGFYYNNGSFTLTGTAIIGRMEEMSYSNYQLDQLIDNYILYQDSVYHLSSRTSSMYGVYSADVYYSRGNIEYLYNFSLIEYVYSPNDNAYPSGGSTSGYWGTSAQTVYVKQY